MRLNARFPGGIAIKITNINMLPGNLKNSAGNSVKIRMKNRGWVTKKLAKPWLK
ncbi:MAG: hypothetical protein Q4A06_04415 [Cardiobacteriaceae bacterium]|nr:hypothetical protein [Cardiobacteriaceae bacterium]